MSYAQVFVHKSWQVEILYVTRLLACGFLELSWATKKQQMMP